jgi:hypothetical protein
MDNPTTKRPDGQTVKTPDQQKLARLASREEALREAIRKVPPFNGVASMEAIALQHRRVRVTFYPHMVAIFAECGYEV